jgi:hypothetical protein
MAAPTNAAKREKSSCQPGAVHTWHFNLHKKDKDVTMKRDLLVMGGAMLALGLAMWMVWGNPEMSSTPKASVVQSFGPKDPDLRVVTERGPYVRNER